MSSVPPGPPAAGYGPPPPRARRRRRWPLRLAIALVVLVVLFVVADRVSLAVAERAAGSTLQNSQHLSERPSVSVDGFPFLTQLAGGEFDHVTVVAHDVPVNGAARPLNVDSLTVDLYHVDVARDLSSVRAATATADARVDYAALSRALGVQVSYRGNGRVSARATVTVAGQQISGQVSAVVHASSSAGLSFSDPRVSAAGQQVPAAVVATLGAIFGHTIPLDRLPFGVQVEGVTASADGLHIQLRGTDLVYRGS